MGLQFAYTLPSPYNYRVMSIIPVPAHVRPLDGRFVLSSDAVLVAAAPAQRKAEQLAAWLRPATGFALPVVAQAPAGAPAIHLRLEAVDGVGAEGYALDVGASTIVLRAPAEAGLMYAAQSLRQLLPPQIFSKSAVAGVAWSAPCQAIVDQPRFGWRGMHLDVGRHFMPLDTIRKYIDLLALHKMNVLHWHLTEDQGWRIEIRKYPQLTKVGAFRPGTIVGHQHEYKTKDVVLNGIPHGGFYTQDEARAIVEYAAQHHIAVLPEIEMPGHAGAAIAAYPELGNLDHPIAVSCQWGIHKHVVNVEESTVRFYQDVLAEILEIFPNRYIHIGGDECPKDEWKASPRVQARMRELGIADEHELQSWFIRRMDVFLNEHGRVLIGWDEILEGGLAPNAVVMSWRGEDGGIAAAKAGHDVVMAPYPYTYLDYYQSEDREKEPLAIGGFLPLEKVYSYEPIPAALSADEGKHVLGAQCQLWTEYIPTPEHLDYMAFPRACALAEVVWSPTNTRDFAQFSDRLAVHLQRLDTLGVAYRRAR
jgi:hexosaminidase